MAENVELHAGGTQESGGLEDGGK